MQTKFKRHQKVKLLLNPDPEYLEYHTENQDNPEEKPKIIKGMKGKINLILQNGQYHVEIQGEKGEPIAYAKMDEEALESA
jgi:hypothetical protein